MSDPYELVEIYRTKDQTRVALTVSMLQQYGIEATVFDDAPRGTLGKYLAVPVRSMVRTADCEAA